MIEKSHLCVRAAFSFSLHLVHSKVDENNLKKRKTILNDHLQPKNYDSLKFCIILWKFKLNVILWPAKYDN